MYKKDGCVKYGAARDISEYAVNYTGWVFGSIEVGD